MAEISLSLSFCLFQTRSWASFPAHPLRGLSSLLCLSWWTTRDLLTKIARKNTFHRLFLSRRLNASAIFQLPYDHSGHGHSCQQKTRKQESPCESDLTEDRFVTSLQVENRSPTAQKGTGHFSTLISEASSSYVKCTEHLMERNVQSATCFRNNFFWTGPPRTGWQWLCKVTCESAELPQGSQTPGRTGRAHTTFSPNQQLVQLPHFTNEQTQSSLHFQHVDLSDPGICAKARVFVINSLLKNQNLPQSSRYVTSHSLYLFPSHYFLRVSVLVALSLRDLHLTQACDFIRPPRK